MGYFTTENVAPLTAVKASTWTKDRLGQRIQDDAGRKYVFVQLGTSSPVAIFGRPVGLRMNVAHSMENWRVAASTISGAHNSKFLGVACNKDANASAGQKFWVCYEGPLGKIPNSKLKSAQTPLTLWVSTHATIASGDFLAFSQALHYLFSANMSTGLQRVVGQAFSLDVGNKLTKGFIKSNIIT